ncbi:response regulator [Brachybacterium hainanense]|uniref:Response regulator n=1 Tax=Brachybacterium hainanense TaxID=1541174 RepID=A0ABV6RD45_9MICO
METVTQTATGQVRLLVVDDEALMRAGLRLMLDGAEGITVVGEAGDGVEALAAVAELDPDVVLMDLRMPTMDGIEATGRLRKAGSRPAVVVLTAFDTDSFLLRALRAGAVSFLLKDTPPQDVVQAVHEAARGGARFSPTVLTRLIRLAAREDVAAAQEPEAPAPPAARTVAPAEVTAREWDVAQLVAQGLTNGEIGEALMMSLPTVKTHVGHLFEKLHVTNRVQLAIRVLER